MALGIEHADSRNPPNELWQARQAIALERIADALEVQNAASLGQISMDPASPGALRLVQVVTDVIVKRLQEMNRRNQQLG